MYGFSYDVLLSVFTLLWMGKSEKYKREYVGSFQVNKSKHILSIKFPSERHTIYSNPPNAK